MCRRSTCLSYFVLVLSILYGCVAFGFDANTDPSLVGLWQLDDGSGTVAIDSSPNGNNGTFVGTPQWVEGYCGSGLYLDGSSAAVEIANPLNLNSNNVTITAWVKRNGEQSPWAAFVFTRAGGSAAGFGHSETIELRYHWNDATWAFSSGLEPPDNEWFFAALVIEPTQGIIYLNEQTAVNATTHDIEEFGGALFIGQDPQGGRFMDGTIDEVAIYNRSLTQEEIKMVMIGVSPALASDPTPANEATDVTRDVVLSWTPGIFADKHDVYSGTVLEDVSNADTDSPLLVSPAQDSNSYNACRLDFGHTYFWRVDEVNAPPEATVFKGDIWSFTVEPRFITIPGERITATASSQTEGRGPEQTVNNSGLDANDLHSKDTEDMWITAEGETGPAWIQYEFDKVYKLHEMLVWNYNGASILYIFGFKDVIVEYATDGTNWTQLSGISEFAPAPGADNYAANTVVPFEGVAAKYVKISASSNWSAGLYNQLGLSEVHFKAIPVSAREPNPESETTDVAVDATLSWRAGREAQEHKVYISTDQQAVTDGTVSSITVSDAKYGPLSLEMESTYYWRIDEVNNAETPVSWQSNIWSFTTQEYLVVDDFESYNDIDAAEEGSNLIYLTWSDGFDNPTINGSNIGYIEVFQPTMESEIVHSGEQSVPLTYDNSVARLSEVTVNTADLAIGSDWSKGGAQTLVLWFYGDPNNSTTEQMYVNISNNKVIYDGDPANVTKRRWTQWNIDLASLGINLSNVTTFIIGFERTSATGGSGTVFIDDIRVYRSAPPIPILVDPGTDSLVAYYAFENNAEDSSGNGYHGTVNGNPTFVQSTTGYGIAMQFDGVDDFVEVQDDPAITFTASDSYTIAAWAYVPDISGTWRGIAFKGRESGDNVNYYGICIGSNGGVATWYYGPWPTWGSAIPGAGWYHVAVIQDGAAGTKQLHINGVLDSETSAQAADAAGSLIIGASFQTGEFFNGIVDEVRLYNQVLSAGEILYLADN